MIAWQKCTASMINCNYIHIPKTGGHSVKKYLNIEWKGSRHAHRTAQQIINEEGQELWDKSINITTVRNPYDRAISLWSMNKNAKTFEDWCRTEVPSKPWCIPQVNWTHSDDNEPLVDLVLKFEDIDRWTNLPHIGRTKHVHYEKYYTEELQDIIHYAFYDDFIYFNYDEFVRVV